MNLHEHPYFEPWADPRTGIVSYRLTERVAPLQKSLYFVNASVSDDDAWLWFEAAWPPGDYKLLAAVCLDPAEPDIRVFPAAAFQSASPLLTDGGRACFFAMRTSIFRQPLTGEEPEEVLTLPQDYIDGRMVRRISTHLTRSADGRYLLLDGQVGNRWFVAVGERATGEVRIVKEFARNYNHGQFSPTDPDLFEIAQDHWRDPITGQYLHYDHRIWLMNVEGTRCEPLQPGRLAGVGTGICHEWFADDGTLCWVDYEQGAYECDLAARDAAAAGDGLAGHAVARPPAEAFTTHVWKRSLCHAHCDPTRRWWVADESPYRWAQAPCQVLLYDRETGRESAIASALPQPPVARGMYHIDPHPRFTPSGEAIVYTTTLADEVDVAVTPVAPAVERLNE
jgi:hypothetical protein